MDALHLIYDLCVHEMHTNVLKDVEFASFRLFHINFIWTLFQLRVHSQRRSYEIGWTIERIHFAPLAKCQVSERARQTTDRTAWHQAEL